MKRMNLVATIRRGAEAVWNAVAVLWWPAVLLGWAFDDTLKTLAAALVLAAAPENGRDRRRGAPPRA